MPGSLRPHGLYRNPWNSPGQSTGVPNPGIEPRSPHCKRILYQLSHQGSPSKGKKSPSSVSAPRFKELPCALNLSLRQGPACLEPSTPSIPPVLPGNLGALCCHGNTSTTGKEGELQREVTEGCCWGRLSGTQRLHSLLCVPRRLLPGPELQFHLQNFLCSCCRSLPPPILPSLLLRFPQNASNFPEYSRSRRGAEGAPVREVLPRGVPCISLQAFLSLSFPILQHGKEKHKAASLLRLLGGLTGLSELGAPIPAD